MRHAILISSFFLTCLSALSSPAAAQGDYRLQKLSTATLGKQLRLSLTGMPQNKLLVLMLSLNGGPTPLSSLIGQDTRSVDVGVDFVGEWLFANSGSGSLPLAFALPNVSSLKGLEVHVQSLTSPGSGNLIVDKISNKVVIATGVSGASELLTTKLISGRVLANAFVNKDLSNSGGDIVLAGGGAGSEIFDFHTLTTRKGPDLVVARTLNTCTVLSDGRVLIAGGLDIKGQITTSAEIYDPKKNSFAVTGAMKGKRMGHEAALLPDGRVLVVGGAQILPDPNNILAFLTSGLLNTAEIYDPKLGTWSTTGNTARKLFTPALITLKTGKVLLCGGVAVTTIFGIPTGMVSTTACQRFDATTGKWGSAASMKTGRALHASSTVRLTDGRVLTSGGTKINFTLTTQDYGILAQSEVYDPVKNTWTSLANLPAESTGHVATLLLDGRVFVTGIGAGSTATNAGMIAQAFDHKTNAWSKLPDLKLARSGHAAFVTPDGLLVMFGGGGAATTGQSIEVIHP